MHGQPSHPEIRPRDPRRRSRTTYRLRLDILDSERKAIDSIARRRVDIVVLDLHLKEGTGFGVLRAIRHLYAQPRVLVLTNYDLPEYKQAAVDLGATDFLDKARDYARLPAILTAMITNSRLAFMRSLRKHSTSVQLTVKPPSTASI